MKKTIQLIKSFAVATFMMVCYANVNAQVLFYEPFNNNLGQMTAGASSNGSWQFNNTCPGSIAAGHTSPGTAQFIGAGCQFGNGGLTVSGNMTSPNITIGATGATLVFNYRINTECGATPCGFDVVTVQGSTNAFATATTLATSSNTTLTPNGTVWGTATVSLAAFSSTTMQLRFIFNSGDGIGNAIDGIYIDDITVAGTGLPQVSGLAGPYCANAPAVTLTGNPLPGTFSGPGVTGTSFNPATAGAGTHTISFNSTVTGPTYSIFPGLATGIKTGVETVVTLGDDQVSGALPLGFTFNYWGTAYTNLYLSSNGFINFTNDVNSACCSGAVIPNAASPNNIIAGSWNDLNGGTKGYFVTGAAPNRVFCLNMTANPHFGGGGTPVTVQYQFYESTGVIEIHSTNNISDGSTQTMGLENAAGTVGVSMPSRNSTTTFNVVNEMTRFVPYNAISGTSTMTVVVNPLPTVTSTSTPVSGAVCAGSTATLTGGGASTYTWTGGVTNGVAFTPAATTTYTVTGTSAAGCTNTSTRTITVNPLPTVTSTSTPVSGAVCAGSTATLTGGGASTYTWTGGVTNGVAFTPAATTTYTVTGTSAAGCTNTSTRTITVNPLPTVTASATATTVCAGDMVTLNGGGASTYTWTGGVTDAVAFAPASSGTYTVTGTSGAGCTNTSTIAITVNALPTVTASSTASAVCAGGMVTLTGGGATSYTWDNSVVDGVAFAPASTLTYNVTGTDGNGCVNTAATTVTVNALPTVTASSTASAVCAGGMVTLTGGGATSYTWDNSVVDGVAFAPASTLTYNVTGTDGNGCVNTAATTVTVNALPTVTGSASLSTLCDGDMVTLTGGGATSYAWDNSVVDGVAFAATTATTTYNVVGTDGNGCTNTASVNLTVNALPTVTASSTASAVCSGGMVTLTGGGATSYTWDNSVVDGVAFTPASTLTYNVMGTDANGCMNTAATTVTVNALPTVTGSASSSTLCDGDMVTLTGGGATSYVWDNSAVDGVAFAATTATTTYNVVGTDGNGCTNTASVSLTVNALPTVTATASLSTICVGDSVNVTGGGAVSYVWDNSVVDGVMFAPADTTTYNVIGTDANGCMNTASTTIVVNPLPTVTASVDNDTVCAGTMITLTGGGATSYTWDNGATDAVAFASTVSTGYNVIGTDVNGCKNSDSVYVMVNALPSVTMSAFTAPVCLQLTSVALTGGSPAGGVYSGTGVTGTTFNPTTAGVGTFPITYTVTDTNSCSNAASSSITVQDCTGIEENLSSSEVNVYPNPTMGSFNIAINNVNVDELVISIFDIQGREVFTSVDRNVNGAFNKQINLEEVSKGLYYIKLSIGSEVKIQKLIVQ